MESNENNPAENLDVNKPQEVSESEALKRTTSETLNESTTEVVEVTEKFVPESRLKLQKFQDKVAAVKTETQKMVIGQHELVDQIILAIFAGGHVLLEGVPGIAKTLTAKVISKTLSVAYSRIQFTPDLMPSDVLGTSVFNVKTSEFTYKKGPIFSNIVLIDEINRSPAKTQAALFEAMEERQITNDGQTFKMEPPFFIIATQNPIEQEGTYRLPEAQLDRFLFRIKLEYPSIKDEIKILQKLVKQRKESADIYISQNRNELAEVEINQSKIIEGFLPEQISSEEIEIIITDIIKEISAEGMKDMGKVMGMASAKLSGKADGKTISNIVRAKLT